jgi:hypothetical protein
MIVSMKRPPVPQIDRASTATSAINTASSTRRSSEGRAGALDRNLLEQVEAVLSKDPDTSNAELARRLNASVNTIKKYRLKIERGAAQVLKQAAGEKLARAGEDLLDRVACRTDKLEAVLDKIFARAEESGGEISRNSAEVFFRGHAVLEKFYRLFNDLHEQFSPAEEDTGVVNQVKALVQGDGQKYPPEFVRAWAEAQVRWQRPRPQAVEDLVAALSSDDEGPTPREAA